MLGGYGTISGTEAEGVLSNFAWVKQTVGPKVGRKMFVYNVSAVKRAGTTGRKVDFRENAITF